MKCDCNEWKANLPLVNDARETMEARNPGSFPYRGKVFVFCPWCAARLKPTKHSSVRVRKPMSIEQMWEKGIEHHPKSEALGRSMADIDFSNGDCFDFKFGGDGDNGEQLLYILDILVEREML